MFKNSEQYNDRKKVEKEFSARYKNLNKPDDKELGKVLSFFKDRAYFPAFYRMNMKLTKADIKGSVAEDLLMIQAVNNLKDIDKSINMLIKRLREWYALYNPEFEEKLKNQEKFVELVLKKGKKDLLREIKVDEKDSMGADLAKKDIAPILNLGKEVTSLYALRKTQEDYLTKLMEDACPNLLAVAGAAIGARLIGQAGGLKQLMLFPASTIQLLGAEKALFRHMKTKSRAPKYGFLHEHPLILKSPKKMHGRVARALADKISIAVKVDYFKGKLIGGRLRKELEKRFKR
ncbi:C/D box methylation guide ribonucleoprotein complex aNOP56 subunit [Candidatus Woesearchaeota archaeon]|nr:C/D box methylation guide ribonucleoprotein complex aNOP56 subunit [Candidatus Woesearchaeota archaeon]